MCGEIFRLTQGQRQLGPAYPIVLYCPVMYGLISTWDRNPDSNGL